MALWQIFHINFYYVLFGLNPYGRKLNNKVDFKQNFWIVAGVVVKCHKTRSLTENQKHARLQMIDALDRKLNGDMCVAEQEKRINAQLGEERNRRRAELRQKKAAWKRSLEQDSDNKNL